MHPSIKSIDRGLDDSPEEARTRRVSDDMCNIEAIEQGTVRLPHCPSRTLKPAGDLFATAKLE